MTIDTNHHTGPKLDNRGLVRTTLYMPPGVHDALREAAYVRRKSFQAILREAISQYTARELGAGTWQELDDRAGTDG